MYVSECLVAAVNAEECHAVFSFDDWLASVTERINQTMHYQFDGLYALSNYLFITSTQCHSVANSAGCFQQRLFVCLFVNTITSERVYIG